jgi:hypothetical protein
MLTLEEREIAERAVAIAIMHADKPRAVLVSMVADEDFKLDFPLDPPTARDLARAAIKMCEASQWDRLPPWLQQILANVAQTDPIKKILAKISTPPPNWKTTLLPNAFDALWIPRTGLPFLDRLKVREALKALNEPTGPSVLIVNGPQKSGKSYCLELVHHAVAENMKAAGKNSFVPVARVSLQAGMGASLSPEKLANQIVSAMTDNPKPLPILGTDQRIVTADRLNEHLCGWIVDNAEKTKAVWWIGLDGLNDPDLLPATRNFIAKLVELVSEGGKYNNKLRLIIIDYSREHLVRFAEQIKVEELGPIGEVDVEVFFRRQLEELGAAPTDKQVKMGVVLAMMHLPQDGSRLQALNDTLRTVVTNLSKER